VVTVPRIVFVCPRCGFKLYDYPGEGKYHGIPSAAYVAETHGGVCPACGAPLRPRASHVIIVPRIRVFFVEDSHFLKPRLRG
jgi:hypothetical protein